MLHGATQVLFEGVPTHPDAGRAWDIVDKYKVGSGQPCSIHSQRNSLRYNVMCAPAQTPHSPSGGTRLHAGAGAGDSVCAQGSSLADLAVVVALPVNHSYTGVCYPVGQTVTSRL